MIIHLIFLCALTRSDDAPLNAIHILLRGKDISAMQADNTSGGKSWCHSFRGVGLVSIFGHKVIRMVPDGDFGRSRISCTVSPMS